MITRDDWLQAVTDATAQVVALEASDALTMEEFARLLGMGRYAANRRLSVLLASGRAVRTTKQIRKLNGAVIRVTAYRLVTQTDS